MTQRYDNAGIVELRRRMAVPSRHAALGHFALRYGVGTVVFAAAIAYFTIF